MFGKYRKRTYIWTVAFFVTVIISVTIFLAGCKKQNTEQPPEQSNPEQQQEQQTTSLSLKDLIRSRRSWGWDIDFTSWYGTMAPDFNLTDITGKQHRLSDYRGKDVMLVFWATWCPPCIMEMPHLIELRKTIEEEKLAVLAISYITTRPPNTTEMVKSMVEQRKINYSVISVDRGDISRPYNQVNSIPCSFFIDPEGKIKLATVGVLSLNAIRAILQAK